MRKGGGELSERLPYPVEAVIGYDHAHKQSQANKYANEDKYVDVDGTAEPDAVDEDVSDLQPTFE